MYFVKYGDKYIHDPRVDDQCKLLDLTLSGEENSCGYCDFTIYPDHPQYNKIKEHDADNPIEVYDGDILLFAGFIYELGTEFYLDGHVKCKGELDYLNESIIRPYSTYQRGYGNKAPDTIDGYFNWLIGQHNRLVRPNKQFTVGINQGANIRENNTIYRENDRYPKTIEEISEKLLNHDGVGGYLRVRHESGVRYIDYLSEWTDTNAQILDFGENLTGYTLTDDSVDLATCIVPLGARKSECDYSYSDGYFETKDTKVDTSKEYYVKMEDGNYSKCSNPTAFEAGTDYYEYNPDNDESDLPLTIEGFNYGVNGYATYEDMVFNEAAFAKYGWIVGRYEDQDLTTKEELISAAIVILKQMISPKRTIEVKAIDMHLIDPSIKPIRIGEYVRVRSKPHKLDSYFLCTNIDLDLNNPENSVYTLGTTYDTLTGQQNKKINELNSTVNQQYESANKKSEESSTVAKDAVSAASEARDQAINAFQQAQIAQEESIAAKYAADEATANVELIQGQVTEIRGDANKATEAANAAALKSEQAQVMANASAEESGKANAIANAIKDQIDDVTGDAASLREAIEGDIETKTSEMTADFAKKTELTETETNLKTAISESAAAIKLEASQTYAKKTDLTDVTSNMQTSIEQNAQSINSTAEELTTVKTDLSTAQNGVDKAQELANTAQNKADAAGENASAAQSAADTAKELADQVQKNLGDLDSAVSKSFSDVNQTAKNISAQVGTVSRKLSDLYKEGVNLYVGTKDFDSPKWINLDQWETWEPEEGWPYKEYGRWGAWQGIHQTVDVVEGDVYTFSFYASGDDDCQMNVFFDWDSTATTPDHFELGAPTNGTYTRYSVTFVAAKDGEIKARVENSVDSWLQVCALKLERGNVATDWSQSPLDTYDKISRLEQTSEGFSAEIEEAGKTASSFLSFTDLGLIIGDLLKESLGKNVLIDENGVSIRDGDSVLAAFKAGGMTFEKPVVFTADGILLNNGDAYTRLGQNQVLFTHATGYYMNASQSVNFTANISRQLSGAVFCWCSFDGIKSTNKWRYFFVPKTHVINSPGAGISFNDPYLGLMKYLYVSNGGVSGVAENGTNGTTNGIAWNNKAWTLRYVIGV